MEDGRWQPGDVVPVRFEGGRARSGPMTVGQANMRRCVLRDDPAHMNACVVRTLPAGSTTERLADVLATLALRHETLRTTYPEQPELHQEVAGSGAFAMAVHPADGDPDGCAREVGLRLRAARFDPPAELPVRAAVVTEDGVPVRLVLVYCHIAVDAAALDLLGREWTDLLAGKALPEPNAVQPVDLALSEQEGSGRRRLVSSLRYWDDLLRTTPQAMFAVPGVGASDWMHSRLRIRSRAAAAALEAVSARTGASRPNVVLAAMCTLLGHRLGQRTFVAATLAANRFLPELAAYTGTVAQDALMSVRLDAGTFDEVVRRVRTRSLAALRHSWFDYEELLPVIRGAERDRGTHWARDCVFNDLTSLTLEGLANTGTGDGVPVTGRPGGARGDLRLDWSPPESMPTRLMLWAVRLEEEMELGLWADPRCLPAREAEDFAADLVALVTAAADGDVDLNRLGELTGGRPVVREDGWHLVDSCWVELAAVRELVAEALGARPHLVAAVPDGRLGHRLECHLTADGPPPDLAALHTACLAGLPNRLTAMAPHRYTVHRGVPDDPGDPAAWLRLPATASGTGREPSADTAAGVR